MHAVKCVWAEVLFMVPCCVFRDREERLAALSAQAQAQKEELQKKIQQKVGWLTLSVPAGDSCRQPGRLPLATVDDSQADCRWRQSSTARQTAAGDSRRQSGRLPLATVVDSQADCRWRQSSTARQTAAGDSRRQPGRLPLATVVDSQADCRWRQLSTVRQTAAGDSCRLEGSKHCKLSSLFYTEVTVTVSESRDM